MKLPKTVQKKLEETEAGSFKPIPADIYEAKVENIEAGKGPAGPLWKWTFKIASGDYKGRNQWLNTSHSDEALWKLKETLLAFDADMDTDSDDLIGRACKLVVSEGVVGAGAKKGQPTNNVDAVLAADDDRADDDDGPEEDLEGLGQAADADDEAAMDRLEELAEAAGLDPDSFDTWALLAKELATTNTGEKEEEAADEFDI